MTRVLSDEAVAAIQAERGRYPDPRSALLPALHIAQNEVGWCSADAIEDVAAVMELPTSDVEEVVSFYTMFYEDRVGSYVMEVCKTVPCAILGADQIIGHIADRLGISPGGTTPDGMFTLLRVECLAACHRAPVMQVNSRYYENLTPERVDQLLDLMRRQAELRRGQAREAPLPPLIGRVEAV